MHNTDPLDNLSSQTKMGDLPLWLIISFSDLAILGILFLTRSVEEGPLHSKVRCVIGIRSVTTRSLTLTSSPQPSEILYRLTISSNISVQRSMNRRRLTIPTDLSLITTISVYSIRIILWIRYSVFVKL